MACLPAEQAILHLTKTIIAMIFCANCGMTLQDDATFCPECGTKTEKPEVAATNVNTGTAVSNTSAVQEQTTVVPVTPVAEIPPPPKQFCRNCGKEVTAGAFACMNCGLPPLKANSYCNSCGATSHPDAVVCIKCGIKLTNRGSSAAVSASAAKIYCRNCGKEVLPSAVACVSCGLPPMKGKTYCNSCGSATNPDAVVCIKCGVKLGASSSFSGININTGSGQTNPALMTGAFWGSLMVLVGFFMPWVKIWGGINGAKIAGFIADSGGSDSGYSVFFYLLPVSAAIFLISAFTGKVSAFALGVRYIPLVLLIITVIAIASKSSGRDSDDGFGMDGGGFFEIIGIGFIITIIGAIMMCFYNPKKE